MKGFYISIKNDLLEPKHYQNMGESVWLFMWLLDKVTSISENGTGKVSGGKPLTTEDIQVELGLPIRTYRRHIAKLKKHGYIQTKRTPYGLVFSINKASKAFKRSATNGTIDVPPTAHPDVPQSVRRSATKAQTNKDNSTNVLLQDNNKTNTNVLVGANAPVVYGNADINDLFAYWQQHTGLGIRAKVRSNRNACSTLLKRYGVAGVRRLIDGVELGLDDQFAPRITDFVELQDKCNNLLVWGRRRAREVVGDEPLRFGGKK